MRSPAMAKALEARWSHAAGHIPTAAIRLSEALVGFRHDAWLYEPLVDRSLTLAAELGPADPRIAAALLEALSEPFAVHILDERRLHTRLELSFAAGFTEHCVAVFESVEPAAPWRADALAARAVCYRDNRHPLADLAAAELAEFQARAPAGIE